MLLPVDLDFAPDAQGTHVGVRVLHCDPPSVGGGGCCACPWSAVMFGCDGNAGAPCGFEALPMPSDCAIAICWLACCWACCCSRSPSACHMRRPCSCTSGSARSKSSDFSQSDRFSFHTGTLS